MRVVEGRTRLVVAGVMVALGLLASPLAVPSDAAGSAGGTPHDNQRVDFGPCQDETLVAAGAECATVTVPLDHRNPHGTTIDVAISRLAARDPEQRRGVLLANPGGPGSPGLTYAAHLRPALGEAADRYDLIGFDPRLTGLSSPITCGPTRFSDTFRSAGQDRAGFRESRDLAADFAGRCHDRHADVLPFGGTPDVARDMDMIRSALGEARISYFGVSWGAHLGSVYSELFPDRVDRMVLDSSNEGVDYELLQQQGSAAEAALDEWAQWTAERDGEYHLGTTGAAVRMAVEDLVTRVASQPITIEVGGQAHVVDDNTLPLLLQRWLNHEDDNASLSDAVRDLVDAAAGQPMTPSPELAERLAFFDAHDPMLDNGLAAAWANICNDGSWPSGSHPYWRQVQRSRRTQPLFGPLANNVKPCAFWSATSTEPPVAIGNAVPILMVQAERDNTTPLANARRVHERLTGSRLITADVRAHGAYGRATDGYTPIPCIDQVVNDYLGAGTFPDEDTSCG
jgi:pimeloyl-ACP methyl ester carboxylesterase